MAYYYVKSGFGTRTSSYGGSKQSVSFASIGAANVYATIGAVYSYNTVQDGDTICVSDAHDETVSNLTAESTDGGFTTIISVNDSAADEYSRGASLSSTSYISIQDTYAVYIAFKGFDFEFRDYFGGSSETSWFYCYDCTFTSTATSSSDYIFSSNGNYYLLEDCDITCNNTIVTLFNMNFNSRLTWNGGSLLKDTNDITYLINYLSPSGATYTFNNIDFSAHSSFDIYDGVSYLSESNLKITFNNCKMPASWDFYYSSDRFISDRIQLINCDNSVNYHISNTDIFGTSQIQTTYYRTAGSKIDSTSVSYQITTTSDCHESIVGHKVLLGSYYANFNSARTVKVYMEYSDAGSTNLQDDEIWIEAYVPSATGPDVVKYSSYLNSAGQGGIFFLDTAADYDNNNESWSGSLTNAVTQEMSITTAGSEGQGFVDIYITLSKPSTTVYVDLKVEIV